MKVINYSLARERIEWQRSLKLSAMRDDILIAVATQLRSFAPNTPSNIKHPWKPSERHSARAWCPRHDGCWARLIVRVDADGHVTYECNQGCSSGDVEAFLNRLTRADHGRNAEAIATSTIGEPDSASGLVYEAQHLFRSNKRKMSGPRSVDFHDDPAA